MNMADFLPGGFPQAILPCAEGGLPVEVSLIARLAAGNGDRLIADAARRQQSHPGFVAGWDEPSVRLGGLHDRQGDRSTLYSFVVGEAGHPFHRHAGHRVFTAVAGSSGARLHFSRGDDRASFQRGLRAVSVPADSLFTVRFGGGTWHQFLPGQAHRGHPALFALSCHPDEYSGALDAQTRAAVASGEADIATLTELLPQDWLGGCDVDALPPVVLQVEVRAA